MTNPLPLLQALIRRPSVTPLDEGALDVLQEALEGLGFACRRMPFAEDGTPDVDNLYARLGTGSPHFCFAGHTDVVPVGGGWTVEPFGAEVIEGHVYGRGAADMKGGIACFVAAVQRLLENNSTFKGSISFLITGDEEGPGLNGTVKMLKTLAAEGETWDHCLVGEPTNPLHLGEMTKVGRRGSLNAKLTVYGTQGHTAYPERADNPVPRLARMVLKLTDTPLDEGSALFQASTVAFSSVDVGNPTTNVIPAQAEASFNVRFNDLHSSADVEAWIRARLDEVGGDYDLSVVVSGESFVTQPETLACLLADVIKEETGREVDHSTSGGTSDARFIKDYCPVVEFGLVGATMHKADERASLKDLETLTRIYLRVLQGYFGVP